MYGFFSGFEPWKITHASDNFGILYEFAVDLIKRYDVKLKLNTFILILIGILTCSLRITHSSQQTLLL